MIIVLQIYALIHSTDIYGMSSMSQTVLDNGNTAVNKTDTDLLYTFK